MKYKLPPNYYFISGSSLERASLVKFMQKTYQELFPEQNFSHLAITVEKYFSAETPLWWVEEKLENAAGNKVGCLWLGNGIDQVKGDRHAHIFLLYVAPEHRRQGLGKSLMQLGEDWAKNRGDRQISLQVFQSNQPAVNLYSQLGFQTQSLWMVKYI
ncbi:GNAT family N-acetyltransferase [Phormidium sp. LEGE 05292]|uniref:GNAT family N-acetyltransferase n=1 Tax=[Phormidium] sp. LEGE 05292 TaxID=767427 RepID=UPI0018821043|nr:GNAT family N-acetyltransferase [Phormidium sp. LEGE 05292]MBE9228753.1 GNAT family N-acetyltransferase [Phormidium sp. LEGE 05292]